MGLTFAGAKLFPALLHTPPAPQSMSLNCSGVELIHVRLYTRQPNPPTPFTPQTQVLTHYISKYAQADT